MGCAEPIVTSELAIFFPLGLGYLCSPSHKAWEIEAGVSPLMVTFQRDGFQVLKKKQFIKLARVFSRDLHLKGTEEEFII